MWENYSWNGQGSRSSWSAPRGADENYEIADDESDVLDDGNFAEEPPELASPMSPQQKVVKDAGNKPTGAVPSGVPSVAGNSASNAVPGGKVSTSYPPIFYARPGESWEDYWRSVTFWVASEGKSLPAEMRGPRLMQQLRERAGKIVQHLSVDKVSGADGIDIIRREMEKSPIIKILDNKKVDRRRQKFMKLGRLPSESIESFLNRAEIYRRENDTSPEYHVGSKFYVGHLLDAAKLTKRDLALIKAATGGTLEDEDKVTTALLELADQLEGAPGCYIGKGETTLDQEDKYLVQKPTSSSSASSSSTASTATGYRRRFRSGYRGGRRLRDTLMAILEDEGDEEDEEAGSIQPDVPGDESCDEPTEDAPGHHAPTGQPGAPDDGRRVEGEDFLADIYAQEFKARNRVREIKKMRQYYQGSSGGGPGGGPRRRGEQDPHVKKWVEERQKTDPCFLCGKLGHWSEECPLRRKGAAGGVQGQVYGTNVTFGASRDSTPDWEFLERYVSASHEYKGACSETSGNLSFDVNTMDVTPVHDTMWSMQEGLGNKMIVDLGCMKTVAGTTWMKSFLARLQDLGRYFQVVREAEKFRFGDGRILQSQFHVVAEVSLATIHCVLRISVVPGECPPLLSKAVCTSLGFLLDTDQHTVSSKKFHVRAFGLDHTGHGYRQGHYVLSVDAFSPHMHPLRTFELPPHVEVQPLPAVQTRVHQHGERLHRGRGEVAGLLPSELGARMGGGGRRGGRRCGGDLGRGGPGSGAGPDGGPDERSGEEEKQQPEAFLAHRQVREVHRSAHQGSGEQASEGATRDGSDGHHVGADGRDGVRARPEDDGGYADAGSCERQVIREGEDAHSDRRISHEDVSQVQCQGGIDGIRGAIPDAEQQVLRRHHVQHGPQHGSADDHVQVEALIAADAGEERGRV